MGNLNTRQKILLVLLVIVVFLYIYVTFVPDAPIPEGVPPGSDFGKPSGQANIEKPASQDVTAKKNVQTSAVPQKSVRLKKYDGDWGNRDPFFRKVQSVVKREIPEEILNIVLHGVQKVKGEIIAVINNEIYREGSVIEGKEIIRIEKDYVVLRDENKEYVLKVGSEK